MTSRAAFAARQLQINARKRRRRSIQSALRLWLKNGQKPGVREMRAERRRRAERRAK